MTRTVRTDHEQIFMIYIKIHFIEKVKVHINKKEKTQEVEKLLLIFCFMIFLHFCYHGKI